MENETEKKIVDYAKELGIEIYYMKEDAHVQIWGMALPFKKKISINPLLRTSSLRIGVLLHELGHIFHRSRLKNDELKELYAIRNAIKLADKLDIQITENMLSGIIPDVSILESQQTTLAFYQLKDAFRYIAKGHF